MGTGSVSSDTEDQVYLESKAEQTGKEKSSAVTSIILVYWCHSNTAIHQNLSFSFY